MEESDIVASSKSSVGRWVLVLGTTLPLAMAAGVGIGIFAFAPPRTKVAPAPSALKCPPPPPSAAPPTTLVERATAGEFKAIDDLKAKAAAERTVEETLALARGRSHNKSAALEGFGVDLKKNPDHLQNKDQLQRLRDFLVDRETTTQAATIVVGLPGTLGPDLFYDVSAAKVKNDTTQLAEDLLATKELRDKASPALLVTLDLHRTEKCEDFKALLTRAHDIADRRALPSLGKLASKRGCGDNKLSDCYECLHPLKKEKDTIDLGDAMKAAGRRPPPKL